MKREEIETVASLSRLRMKEEEIPEISEQLDKFLKYVENLKRIETEKIEPTTYPLPIQNVFRADEVKKSLRQEEALQNAPVKEEGYFKVPRVLEA